MEPFYYINMRDVIFIRSTYWARCSVRYAGVVESGRNGGLVIKRLALSISLPYCSLPSMPTVLARVSPKTTTPSDRFADTTSAADLLEIAVTYSGLFT